MYSTKKPHKYSGANFLGGKYMDPHKIEGKPSRTQGKQFVVLHPKTGNPSSSGVLFSNPSNEKVKRDPYNTGNKYSQSHPLENRKLGFGSHDAPKKDEFLSSTRSEQHKNVTMKDEILEKESVLQNGTIEQQIEKLQGKLDSLHNEYPRFNTTTREETDFVKHVPNRLYDIGRSEEGTTSTMFHDSRDQFYTLKRCQKADKPRHVIRLGLSSADYGSRDYHGMKNDKIIIIGPKKSSGGKFVDKSHLHVSEHYA